MRLEWRELDRRIAALTAEFVARAREHQAARRLATIPGFGALNATALVAAIGTGETFRRARDLAAWLGLVPRQASARPRRLARARAPAGEHGRQNAPARHYQARQHIPAHAADPWRTSGSAVALRQRDAARRVAARPHRASAQEQGRRGACRQAGPDGLGGAALGRELCGNGGWPTSNGLTR